MLQPCRQPFNGPTSSTKHCQVPLHSMSFIHTGTSPSSTAETEEDKGLPQFPCYLGIGIDICGVIIQCTTEKSLLLQGDSSSSSNTSPFINTTPPLPVAAGDSIYPIKARCVLSSRPYMAERQEDDARTHANKTTPRGQVESTSRR